MEAPHYYKYWPADKTILSHIDKKLIKTERVHVSVVRQLTVCIQDDWSLDIQIDRFYQMDLELKQTQNYKKYW